MVFQPSSQSQDDAFLIARVLAGIPEYHDDVCNPLGRRSNAEIAADAELAAALNNINAIDTADVCLSRAPTTPASTKASAVGFAKIPKNYRAKSVSRDARFYLPNHAAAGAAGKGSHSVIRKTDLEPSDDGYARLPGSRSRSTTGAPKKAFPTWQERHCDKLSPVAHTASATFGCLSAHGLAQASFDYVSEKGSAYAYTLNLAPKTERRAYYMPNGSRRKNPAAWLCARAKSMLEAAGLSGEIAIVIEEALVPLDQREERERQGLPPCVRLHAHGWGAGKPEDEDGIRAAFRHAGGRQTKGWAYQCKLQFLPTTGWVGYSLKDLFRSSDFMRGIVDAGPRYQAIFLGPAFACTRKMRNGTKARYDDIRIKYKSSRRK